ncbi:MAG TPA: aromatic amino acid transport family protein [Candidatus Woesebacteria bacterium]|nr:aromatic amino acid transport family protein [Candidatus Woesebacteria bacterium]
MIDSNFIKAVLERYSGIVGAGIFVLPLLFYQSNFYFALLGLVIITLGMIILDRLYVSIILDTSGHHQLPGYARIYLGRFWGFLALANMLILGLGAMAAYVQLGTGFIQLLLSNSPFLICQLIFLAFLGAFHAKGSRLVGKITHYIPLTGLVIVLFLFAASLKVPFNFTLPSSNYAFLGPLVFALTGFVIIPDVERLLSKDKDKKIKLIWATALGTLLAALTYGLFTIAVILLSGSYLSADTVSGLFKVSSKLGQISAILGILLTFKGCLNFLTSLEEVFLHDFRFSPDHSLLLSFLIPILTLSLFKFSFVKIIAFTGSVSVFISALIIIRVKLSQWRIKSKKSRKSLILSR